MKIAVTYDNGSIFQHFGHTEQFKLYNVEEGKVVSAEVIDTNGSGHGALAEILRYLGADHPLAGKLMDSYRDVSGKDYEPLIIGGGTYAKVMPNFLAFGPEPYDEPARAHQADEYITRTELRDAARIYARAIARMAE